MRLSDIFPLSPEQAALNPDLAAGKAYGIEVDGPDFLTPPSWLKESSLVLAFNQRGEIDEALLDTAIAWRLAGIPVILEIPFEAAQKSDVPYLLLVAENIGVSIAFLPPAQDVSEELWGAYFKLAGQQMEKLLSDPNASRDLMPASSYLQYLFIELLEPQGEWKPKDPYVVSRFAERMTLARSDAMKENLRQLVFASYGGKEQFEAIGRGLLAKAAEHAERFAKESREKLIEDLRKSNELGLATEGRLN